MAAEPTDEITAATVVLTAHMAFEARMIAIFDALETPAHGLDQCPTDAWIRPCVRRAAISIDAAGRVDQFLWVENSAGKIQVLSAGVPGNSAPFMVARQLAEEYVAGCVVEMMVRSATGAE